MGRVFSEQEIIRAMNEAERLHPPLVARQSLSPEVSKIAELFGTMVYERVREIEVVDPAACALVEQFLGKEGSDAGKT